MVTDICALIRTNYQTLITDRSSGPLLIAPVYSTRV